MPRTPIKICRVFRDVDPDGLFHTTSAPSCSPTTPTRSRPRTRQNWKGLLDPKWMNQVSVGHPGFSGFVGIWTVQMKKLFGWSYFETLAKHKPQIGRSIIDTVTMLTSGERRLRRAPTARPSCRRRAAIRSARHSGGGRGADELTDGDHEERQPPNAAKLFVEFLHGTEAARQSRTIWQAAADRSSTSPPGFRFTEMKLIPPSVDEIVKGIPEVIEQWRDTFGI